MIEIKDHCELFGELYNSNEDFRDQVDQKGCYSKNDNERHQAFIKICIKKAVKHHHKNSLNDLWHYTKDKMFSEADYFIIKDAYNGKITHFKLSNGFEWNIDGLEYMPEFSQFSF